MNTNQLLLSLRRLHQHIRDRVVNACEEQAGTTLARVSEQHRDDTLYAIDRIGEQAILEFIEREIAAHVPVIVTCEGLAQGSTVLPAGIREQDARWRIIIDPIDGTRGLMYQKRSAWILTGVAENRGQEPRLQDIFLAVQTEIPLVKQHLSDQLWALRGQGIQGRRYNRLTGEENELAARPSQAKTIDHGFATFVRFFPGGHTALSELEDTVLAAVLGKAISERALCFEDQYISTGGQIYGLVMGMDRFVADLRPLLRQDNRLCCHPYDICTELIAREAGVIICDEAGEPISCPLDTQTPVTWIGYANATLRNTIHPHLEQALKKFS